MSRRAEYDWEFRRNPHIRVCTYRCSIEKGRLDQRKPLEFHARECFSCGYFFQSIIFDMILKRDSRKTGSSGVSLLHFCSVTYYVHMYFLKQFNFHSIIIPYQFLSSVSRKYAYICTYQISRNCNINRSSSYK